MPVHVVVGGQYGSEGKGRIVKELLRLRRGTGGHVVRCGGPNSGHTTTIGDKEVIFRQIPSALAEKNVTGYIPAGGVVDLDLLWEEIAIFEEIAGYWDPTRLVIDPRAAVVTPQDKSFEQKIKGSIGSTGSGNGYALIKRMERNPEPIAPTLVGEAVKSIRDLGCVVENVADRLHKAIAAWDNVVIEGNQGFGLSLLHGTEWPYTTSRDVTASGFLSECGIPPRRDTYVTMVIRTFPIRVGGNSGPLKNEITWERVAEIGGGPVKVEMTSVTKKVRRVGEWDWDLVKRAARFNNPSHVALMGLDRMFASTFGKTEWHELEESAKRFVESVSAHIAPVRWIGTSPTTMVLKPML